MQLDDPTRPVHHEPAPLTELAAAVILQAIDDLRDTRGPARRRASARLFLQSTRLEFWCSFLTLSAATIRAWVFRSSPATGRAGSPRAGRLDIPAAPGAE